ncbi:MAG: 50S ribosomal protein L4, partial [Minisyncoccales bacterium]
SAVAGKQQSASGVLVHKRKVWKSQYGKGMSRVPRKVMWQKGSQFNWEGAFSPNTRGGRRAHPPKILSMLKKLKLNKKETKIAFCSALSATANPETIKKRYLRLNESKIKEAPFVFDSEITQKKTKDVLNALKTALGEEIFETGIKKKQIRSGRGKLRGRKYKSNAGLLFVIGKDEKFKTSHFDIKKTNELGVNDLAKGGQPGRISVYTEKAIKDLEERFGK